MNAQSITKIRTIAPRLNANLCADRQGDERNLERFEEKAMLDEDEGQKLEPFNMAAEREEGYFDEEGHYVERGKEEDGDKDAWLASGEGVYKIRHTSHPCRNTLCPLSSFFTFAMP